MTLNDIAEKIAADNNVTKAAARKIVDNVFDTIGGAVAKGEEVAINGFGKFKVKATPSRDGRHPTTGEKITIKASRRLSFSAAKGIKDKLIV